MDRQAVQFAQQIGIGLAGDDQAQPRRRLQEGGAYKTRQIVGGTVSGFIERIDEERHGLVPFDARQRLHQQAVEQRHIGAVSVLDLRIAAAGDLAERHCPQLLAVLVDLRCELVREGKDAPARAGLLAVSDAAHVQSGNRFATNQTDGQRGLPHARQAPDPEDPWSTRIAQPRTEGRDLPGTAFEAARVLAQFRIE